ncbi:MAG: diphthamide synthesis protein [archaeon]
MMHKMTYNLELDKAIAAIKKSQPTCILIQLPDGLKPRAKEIQEALRKHTTAELLIWSGSNFGSCDLPLEVKHLGVDLVLHFGHPEWVYE